MRNFLVVLFLMLFTVIAVAAEDFTLWTNEVFTAPPEGWEGTIATSDTVSNNNGLNGLELIIEYEALAPDGKDAPADYKLSAIIEQQTGTHWYPVAYQFRHIKSSETPTKRIIILGPNVPDFNGSENLMYVGDTAIAAQSFNPGTLGDKFRVVLTVDNTGTADLTGFTVTAFGRKTD